MAINIKLPVSKTSIKPLTVSSANEVESLMLIAYGSKYGKGYIVGTFSKWDYYGYVSGNKILGIISILRDIKDIDDLPPSNPVEPYKVIMNIASINRGVGGMLMDFILTKYPETNLYLTSIDKKTIGFYKKFGFKLDKSDIKGHYPLSLIR